LLAAVIGCILPGTVYTFDVSRYLKAVNTFSGIISTNGVKMITAEQMRAARALVRIDQGELAKASGVSIDTVKRLEGLRGTLSAQMSTVTSLKRALEAAGVIFIDENGGGAGVRLRKPAGDGEAAR
jgi:DNA-binding XRE family transcriptional regulator